MLPRTAALSLSTCANIDRQAFPTYETLPGCCAVPSCSSPHAQKTSSEEHAWTGGHRVAGVGVEAPVEGVGQAALAQERCQALLPSAVLAARARPAAPLACSASTGCWLQAWPASKACSPANLRLRGVRGFRWSPRCWPCKPKKVAAC
jgi:hypothetical protein